MRILFTSLFLILFRLVFSLPAYPLISEEGYEGSRVQQMPDNSDTISNHPHPGYSGSFQGDILPGTATEILQALKSSVAQNNVPEKAKAYFNLAHYSEYTRHFLKAQQYFLAARNNFLLAGDTAMAINSTIRLGSVNQYLNHYKPAIEFYHQAVDLAYRINDLDLLGDGFFYLAVAYKLDKDTALSYQMYDNALEVFKETGNRKKEIAVLTEYGNIYLERNQIQEGLFFYKNLLEQADSLGSAELGTIATKIGHIYDQMKNYPRSLYYNRIALASRLKYGYQMAYSSSMINLSKDLFNLNRPDSALWYLNKGLAIARQYNRLELVVNCYRNLYEYYERTGDYRKAHSYYVEYSSLYEQMLVERNKNHINIIKAQRALEQKIESGNQLLKQNKIQALTLSGQQFTFLIVRILAIIAAVVVIILFIIYFYNRRAKDHLQQVQADLTKEIRDREEKEQQTRITERKFRILSENSIDFVSLYDANLKCIYASPSCRTMLGWEPEEMLQKTSEEIIHPGYQELARESIRTMMNTRKPEKFICKAVRKDGSWFWVESSGNPMFDPGTGEFKGMVALTRDIHERKLKEEQIMEGTKQKENLLKEIHHRVKNNFAILVSLINMQIAQSKDPVLAKSLTNLQLRIRSMSLVHEMLYRSKDFERISFPDYLRSIVTVISGTFGKRDIAVDIEAHEAVLNIDSSIPLGLIVNELISNAFAHAFPEGRSGRIMVSFTRNPEDEQCCLTIRDDGIGLPAGFSATEVNTMGLQIVQLLCNQIEADLQIENKPGASFTIRFRQVNS